MEREKINKSYYAIIPANVRYDKDLTANAKLLYGEITALCNEKGYCWASNDYFAELYKASNRTVSRWIQQLTNKGYVTSNLIYRKGTKEVEQRHLYIGGIGGDKNVSTYRQKHQEGIDKNVSTPIDKNGYYNTTMFNNTNNNTVSSTTPNTNLIETNTNIKLSKHMKKVVSTWDNERLLKSINIFKSKNGKYFTLLEKIYKDDNNFTVSISKTNTNYTLTPNNRFANFDQNFLDNFDDEKEFDKFIENRFK